MQKIIDGLYVSESESLGFGPDLQIRAYLIQRDDGNILVYRSAAVESDAGEIDALGGISRQYLNHSHEASPVTDWVTETFDAPLTVHERDATETAEVTSVHETFSDRHSFGDFEAIPVPGHTPGATVYLWDSGQHRVLFTGDTIFFANGRWVAAVLDGVSDRERYIESLQVIRDLDFDMVVPGVVPAGDPYFEHVQIDGARSRIDQVIERLQNGKNG